MTESAVPVLPEVPTFSECVVGYRAWVIDGDDRLWPASDHRAPWVPGINTARCNCGVRGALSFDWSLRDGQRVLEPHPQHEAPETDCTCGLYSWRRPRSQWKTAFRLKDGRMVCGAVASWGRVMVHDDGFRAEHACVVMLGYPADTDPGALEKLRRVAEKYRVDLVRLDQLEEAASRHGSPVPDTIRPDPQPDPDPHTEPTRRTRPTPPRLTAADQATTERSPAGPSTRSRHVPPPGLEPIATKETVGIGLILAFALADAAAGYMWLGRGTTALVGLGIGGGSVLGITLTAWWLEPHKAAKRVHTHARHRLGHWRQKRREQAQADGGHMSDAEFEAIEDALEPLYRHGNDLTNSFDPYRGL